MSGPVVTQAARDAAAKILLGNLGWYRARDVKAGKMDNDTIVQAFARFEDEIRTATEAAAMTPPDDFAFWRGLGFGLSVCGIVGIVIGALVAGWLDMSVWTWICRRF